LAKSISCTIMAFNEEASLAAATEEVVDVLSGLGRDYEVLIVDDGSRDRTPIIASEMAERIPRVRVVTHPQNRGPGSAILTGFAESKKEIVCFHPADQQIPFCEVAALFPLLDEYDVVVGERSARPGYTIMRRISSRVYIELVHLLFGFWGYKDFNFIYLFRKEILDRMAIESDGVFMTTEVLVRAKGMGARITSARATCLPRRAGVATCGRPSVIFKTIREMMQFWMRWQARRLGERIGLGP
jgi:glycosyltransferase involved in cell wall biosynthesis